MKKTIAVAFYGAVVKDDNQAIDGFFKFLRKCKTQGHRVLVYSDIHDDFMEMFAATNNIVTFTDGDSYDHIISPLAVGCPIDNDGNVDWDVVDTIMEGVLFPSIPQPLNEHLAGIAPHVATDRLKFNVEEGEE